MKKGFTLIELLGVIVILGIIGLIVTPIIQSSLKSSAKKTCEMQVESFKRAAKNYVSQNPFAFTCDKEEECTEEKPKEWHFLPSDLKDAGLLDDFDSSKYTENIIIEFDGKKYKYTYGGNCD